MRVMVMVLCVTTCDPCEKLQAWPGALLQVHTERGFLPPGNDAWQYLGEGREAINLKWFILESFGTGRKFRIKTKLDPRCFAGNQLYDRG